MMRRNGSYIHESSRWPEFAWNSEALGAALSSVWRRHGRLLGKMESLGFDLQSEANLTVLTREVVQSSAIEGQALEPDEVRSSIGRRLGLDVAGLPTAGRDVEGVVEMMLDATREFEAPLTKKRLFDWHASLFPTGRSGMTRITVGGWRTKEADPMQVRSGPSGRETVHFEAPEASRLESEMAHFLKWFNGHPAGDKILHAGIAHLWFVTIHPFEDGNGRMARAIADMALACADGSTNRFYSMSAQIEAERKAYYIELESAQHGDIDITRWLAWFLDCLGRALDGAEDALASVLGKARLWQRINLRPVSDRQRTVVNRMLNDFEGSLSTSKYAKLAKCSADTALREIRELLDRGILVQNPGGGRSTSYRLADPENVRGPG